MVDEFAKPARQRLNSPAYTDHLSTRALTLAEILRPAGYRTLMAGKWHLGYRPEEWPYARGFDRSLCVIDGAMNYFGHGPQHTSHAFPPMALDDKPFEPPHDGFFATDAFTDRALSFISESITDKHQPFFLY